MQISSNFLFSLFFVFLATLASIWPEKRTESFLGELATLKQIFDRGSLPLKNEIRKRIKPFLNFKLKPKDNWRDKAQRAEIIRKKKAKKKKSAKFKNSKLKEIGTQPVDILNVSQLPVDTRILLPKSWLAGIARLDRLCNSVTCETPLPKRALPELAVHQHNNRAILAQNVNKLLILTGNEGVQLKNLSKMVFCYPTGVNHKLYRKMVQKEAEHVRGTSAKKTSNQRNF